MTAPSRTNIRNEFTGRTLALILIAFFAVIISVNLTMAFVARGSWTGFVVRNSYVASQEFNGRVAAARAQRALGWSADLTLVDGEATLSLTDRDGLRVPLASAILVLRSPASDRSDAEVPLVARGATMRAPVMIRDGVWVVKIVARTVDGRDWIDTRRILVRGGTTR